MSLGYIIRNLIFIISLIMLLSGMSGYVQNMPPPKDLAKKLEAQGGVSSVLGGVPGMSSNFKQAIQQLEADLELNKELAMSDLPKNAYQSVGAKKTTTATDENMLWNTDEAGVASTGDALQFNRTVASDENDIFHSNFKGSIFDIVSKRIGANRNNVEQLNYHSPMNRALTGAKRK